MDKEKHKIDNDKPNQVMEKPRICLIDFDDKTYDHLVTKGFNCTKGSLGAIVKVPNESKYQEHYCLLHHKFPDRKSVV